MNTAPKAASSLDRQIAQLEAGIRKLEIDFHRFFAGDLPTPPQGLQEELRQNLARLRSSRGLGVAGRFRLQTFEAKLNSLTGLFGRRLRQHEMGGGAVRRQENRPDPQKGVIVGPEGGNVEVLYQDLYLVDGGKPSLEIEKFRGYIERQAQAIRSKTGCQEILFRVAVEEGKKKLKAKPLRS